jgi:lysine biosynthesis protein LysW
MVMAATGRSCEAVKGVQGATIMSSTFCPDCEGEITLDPRVVLGHRLICPHCGVDLEVIHLDPVWLDWTYVRGGEAWGDYQIADWIGSGLSRGAWAAQDMS